MKRIAIFLLMAIILVSCTAPTPVVIPSLPPSWMSAHIYRFYDKEADVVCWVYYEGGLSCLPRTETKLSAEDLTE